MLSILVDKFSSSRELHLQLTGVKGHFFECSPKDRIWGIGISVKAWQDGEAHKGQNKLGRALDRARDLLMQREVPPPASEQ